MKKIINKLRKILYDWIPLDAPCYYRANEDCLIIIKKKKKINIKTE